MSMIDGQNGPAPVSTASAPSSQTPNNQGASQIPFMRASRPASTQDFAQTNIALGGTQAGPFDVQTNGFLRFLECLFTATASGNGATVAFAGDGPWNAIQNITLQDPSSENIINPYSGYDLFAANKYMGIYESPYADPRADPNYSVTTGAGATGGSFSFVLRLPLEDRERDAFCAVPNSAGNKNYRVQFYTGTSAQIYSTPPTTLPALNVTATNYYWTEPPASIAGAPVQPTPSGNGSVAFLDRETFTGLSGQTNPTLLWKNVGRVFKSVVFILRNSSGVRDSSDWPDPFTLALNGFPIYYKPKHSFNSEMVRAYGYGAQGQALDTIGGLDTGVFAMSDFMRLSGQADTWGPADQYLPSVATSKVAMVGSFGGGASTMEVLQRTLKPISGAALYS